MKSKIRPDSVVMLFFGGYGVQVGRESYMIPVDAVIWKEADVRREGISIEQVLEVMKEQGARAKLVVVDASRRNPYERRFRTFSHGLAPINAPHNALILTSATPGKVAYDSKGQYSLLMAELLGNLNALNDDIKFAVRNNLGGHANHTMFWEIMGPNGGKPEGEVLAAIDRDLGGLEKFQNDFNAAGGRQFGSGWVFVTVSKEGKLAIETRPNQDSPIMDGKRALMGNDVWEHAYYLNYQNRRADYLKAWWNTVNWTRIAERYSAAKAGTLGV
jgi:superoxide dismutase